MKIAGSIILSYEDPNGNILVLLVRDNPLTRTFTSDFSRWYKQAQDVDTSFVVNSKLMQFKFPGGLIKDEENGHFEKLKSNPNFFALVPWANTSDKQTYLSGALRELEEETSIEIVMLSIGEGAFLRYHTKEIVSNTDKPQESVILHVHHWHLGKITQAQINILDTITKPVHDVCVAVWYPVANIYMYDKGVEKIYSIKLKDGRVHRLLDDIRGLQKVYYGAKKCVLSEPERFFPLDPLNVKWLNQAKMLGSCKIYLSTEVVAEGEFERLGVRDDDKKEEYNIQEVLHVPTGSRYALKFSGLHSKATSEELEKNARNIYLATVLLRLHKQFPPRLKLVDSQRGYLIATPQGEVFPVAEKELTDTRLIELIAAINHESLRQVSDEERRGCVLAYAFGTDEQKEQLAAAINGFVAASLGAPPKLGESSHNSISISSPHLVASPPRERVPRKITIDDPTEAIKDLIKRDTQFATAFKATRQFEAFGRHYKTYHLFIAAILTADANLFVQKSPAEYERDSKWCAFYIEESREMENAGLSTVRNYLIAQVALLKGRYQIRLSRDSDENIYDINNCPLRYLYAVYNKKYFITFLQLLSREEKEKYIEILENSIDKQLAKLRRLDEDQRWFLRNRKADIDKKPDLPEREFKTRLDSTKRLVNFLNDQRYLLKGTYTTKQGQVVDINLCSIETLNKIFTKADIIRQLRAMSSEELQSYLEFSELVLKRILVLLDYFKNSKIFANEINNRIEDANNLSEIIEKLRSHIAEIRSSTDASKQELQQQLENYYRKPEPLKLSELPIVVVVNAEEVKDPTEVDDSNKKNQRVVSEYLEQLSLPQLPGLVYANSSKDNNTLLRAVSIFLEQDEAMLREQVIEYLASYKAGTIVASNGLRVEEYAEKIKIGQDVGVEILGSALGRSIIIVGPDAKPINITSVSQLHGDSIFVCSSKPNNYNAFKRKDNFNLPTTLKFLSFDVSPSPISNRPPINPSPSTPVVVAPVVTPVVVSPQPPINPPPPPPVPIIKPIGGLLPRPPVVNQRLSHIIFPINLGTEDKCHWILLQFVASPVQMVQAVDGGVRDALIRTTTRRKIQMENHFTENYTSQHIDLLLKHLFERHRKLVLPIAAMKKEEFLQITSSDDLLTINADAHNMSRLTFTYFDPTGNPINRQIEGHLRKFEIGIQAAKFCIPQETVKKEAKEKSPKIDESVNSGLWIIEGAKALVYGHMDEEIQVKESEVKINNEIIFSDHGLWKIPEENQQSSDVDDNYDWDDDKPPVVAPRQPNSYPVTLLGMAPKPAPVKLAAVKKPAAAEAQPVSTREEKNTSAPAPRP